MPGLGGSLTGKYRKLLIPHDLLAHEAADFRKPLQSLQSVRRAGQLSDAEFTACFVLLFSARRAYGEAWRDNRRCAKLVAMLSWIDNETTPAMDMLPATLSRLQLPGMPGMIFSVLCDWLKGSIGLKLVAYATTAADMLAAQAEGWRYITVDLDAAQRGETVEDKRDAFEFALHDLGHAWAFFKPDYDPAGQIAFFQLLQEDLPMLAPLATADEKFAADLEYCMSDMNSHPEHLRQYLRAVIIEAYYRKRKAGNAEEYSEVALAGLLALLNSLLARGSVRLRSPQVSPGLKGV
mgnify:CR=1 FL=1